MGRTAKLAAVTALVALGAAAESRASVWIGSNAQGSSWTVGNCTDNRGCAVVIDRLPGAQTMVPRTVRVGTRDVSMPKWVIVRWRVRGTGGYKISPITYRSDGSATRWAGTETRTVLSPARFAVFNTRAPIAAGQRVALLGSAGSEIHVRDATGAALDVWAPPPAFTTPTRPLDNDQSLEAAYSVEVEPDADGDGYGDQSQDSCPSNPAVQRACPPPPPSPPPLPSPTRTPTPAPTAAPVAPAAPPVPVDATAPTISRLSIRGAKLRFTLSEPARVTIAIRRPHGKRVIGTLVRAGQLGRNTFRTPTHVRGKHLRGAYRATVVATDAAGNPAPPATRRFRAR